MERSGRRFEKFIPIPKQTQQLPHIAFEAECLNLECSKRKYRVIIEPNPPSEGIRVAIVEHNGAAVKLFDLKSSLMNLYVYDR